MVSTTVSVQFLGLCIGWHSFGVESVSSQYVVSIIILSVVQRVRILSLFRATVVVDATAHTRETTTAVANGFFPPTDFFASVASWL